MVDFRIPFAPRPIRACRFGSAPFSRSGSRILQSAPSQPMRRTRDMPIHSLGSMEARVVYRRRTAPFGATPLYCVCRNSFV